MRKIYSLFLVLVIFSVQDVTARSFSGGALGESEKTTKRIKHRKVVSPLARSNSSYKKRHKGNYSGNLESLRSQNYTQIDDGAIEVLPSKNFSGGLYDDFDEIFQNGRYVGHYKIGNPYKIEGIPYYPQEYEDYEEIGVASWYGEQFDGKLTANGEIYDLDSMTAAHQTLPLPSIVRVTNLDNGKTVKVRVNDRGPFAKSRIIDLSKKAALILDYQTKGTTTVKVEFLPDETRELLEKLKIK